MAEAVIDMLEEIDINQNKPIMLRLMLLADAFADLMFSLPYGHAMNVGSAGQSADHASEW